MGRFMQLVFVMVSTQTDGQIDRPCQSVLCCNSSPVVFFSSVGAHCCRAACFSVRGVKRGRMASWSRARRPSTKYPPVDKERSVPQMSTALWVHGVLLLLCTMGSKGGLGHRCDLSTNTVILLTDMTLLTSSAPGSPAQVPQGFVWFQGGGSVPFCAVLTPPPPPPNRWPSFCSGLCVSFSSSTQGVATSSSNTPPVG
jgi:hypothetical protein